jgi:hypothetical protein
MAGVLHPIHIKGKIKQEQKQILRDDKPRRTTCIRTMALIV